MARRPATEVPKGRSLARAGPDGINRPIAAEDRLNQNFAAWLSTPLGVECMAHLRSITIESAGGPHISNDELRHREGQRFLVAYMTNRKALHEKAQYAHASAASRPAGFTNSADAYEPPTGGDVKT